MATKQLDALQEDVAELAATIDNLIDTVSGAGHPERVLSRTSLAALLDVSPSTVKRMVAVGELPEPSHRVRGHDRWRIKDVLTCFEVRSRRAKRRRAGR